jgi:hypothetical protein
MFKQKLAQKNKIKYSCFEFSKIANRSRQSQIGNRNSQFLPASSCSAAAETAPSKAAESSSAATEATSPAAAGKSSPAAAV